MSMIIISQLIPCKPFSLSSQISQLSPGSPLLLLSATANSLRPSSSSSSSSFPSHKSINRRPGARWEFQVRAADDERESFSGAAAVVVELPVAAKMKQVKKRLVDEFYGTDRGLRASSETRAQIVELINQLESLNPNPAPTQALSLLNGNWILASVSLSLSSMATGFWHQVCRGYYRDTPADGQHSDTGECGVSRTKVRSYPFQGLA